MRHPTRLVALLVLAAPFAAAQQPALPPASGPALQPAAAPIPTATCKQTPRTPARRVVAPPTSHSSGNTVSSHDVTVFCGTSEPSITPGTPNKEGTVGIPPRPPASAASAGSPSSGTAPHHVQLGFKDIKLDITSPSPWVFFATLVVGTAIVGGLLWLLARPKADKPGQRTSFGTTVVMLAGLLALGGVVYTYIKIQPAQSDCRSLIESALNTAGFQEKIARQVETQLRTDLDRCTRSSSELDVRNRILEATSQSWPVAAGTPYALFGVALGVVVGMFAHQLLAGMMFLWGNPSRRGESEREDLLRQLSRELQTREIETLRELLDTQRQRGRA